MSARKHDLETVPLGALLERDGPHTRWADPSLRPRSAKPSASARAHPVEPETTAIPLATLGALIDQSKELARTANGGEPATRALRVRAPRTRRPRALDAPTVAVARPVRGAPSRIEPTLPSVRRSRLRLVFSVAALFAALIALIGSITWAESDRVGPATRHTASAQPRVMLAAQAMHAAQPATAQTPNATMPARTRPSGSPPPNPQPSDSPVQLQEPSAYPALPHASTGEAVTALAEGHYREAIERYRALDQAHPEQPAYGAIAAILTRELAERCAHGPNTTDTECAP